MLSKPSQPSNHLNYSYICIEANYSTLEQNAAKSPFWKDLHFLETLRGGGIYLIVKIAGSLGAYLFAWFVSRKYGAEGNGIFAFTLTSAVLLAAFFNLGLNTYIVKIIPVFRARKYEVGVRTFYRKSLITISGVTLVGCAILIISGMLLPESSYSLDIFRIGVMAIPVSFLLFVSHAYKAQKRILGYSLLQNNVVQVLALIVLLFPWWSQSSIDEPVWAFTCAGIVLCMTGWIYLRFEGREEVVCDKTPFRAHLRESLPMLAGGLAYMILNLSDRMMLRFLDTTTQLGIYDVALRLSNLSLLGILSLNAIAEPKFAEFFAHNDRKSLRNFVRKMTWLGIGVSIPVILALGLFPAFWMGLFGDGKEFLEGIGSIRILLIGQALSVGCGAVLVLLNMTGQQRKVQTILIASALANILLNALLIPELGILGAAWATTITTILWNGWGVWVVYKKLGISMW